MGDPSPSQPPQGHLGWITSRARQQAVVEVLDVGIALDPGVEGLGMVRLEQVSMVSSEF
jgi:hypothetical protein